MIVRIATVTILISSLGWTANSAPLLYGTAYSGPRGAATLYSISPATGAATALGAIGFYQVGALAFAPNGTLYGVGQNGAEKWVLLTVNPATGAGTAIGPTGLDVSFQDIAFSSDGKLFGYARSGSANAKTGLVYSIDATTGTATFAGNTSGGEGGDPIALASDKVLYTVNQRSLGTIREGNTGSVTPLRYSPSLGDSSAQPSVVKFDANGGKLWASVAKSGGGSYLAAIDVKTGNVTPAGPTVEGLHSLAVRPLTVEGPPPMPLPSSLLFLCTGALALLAWNYWMRRRSRTA